MAIRNLREFVEAAKQKDLSAEVFELEKPHLLEVKLLAIAVTPGQPVFTDPNATVAWSGTLSRDIVADRSLTLSGRGSGESIQPQFAGSGWVVVQPYEEVCFQSRAR